MWIWRLWDFHTNYPENRNYPAGRFSNGTREYSDYLTNWNDTIVMLYLGYSMILIFSNLSWSKVDDPAPWFYYISQLLYQFALVNSTLIIIVTYILLPHIADNATGHIHAHIMDGKTLRPIGISCRWAVKLQSPTRAPSKLLPARGTANLTRARNSSGSGAVVVWTADHGIYKKIFYFFYFYYF